MPTAAALRPEAAAPAASQRPGAAWAHSARAQESGLWPPDSEPTIELGFADLLDLVNPLQHIPIVSSIYRAITGDTISAPARIFGGALFGGPIGFMVAIVNTVASDINGGDVADTAIASLFGGAEESPAGATALAAAPEVAPEPQVAPALAGEAPLLTGEAALAALRHDLLRSKPQPETTRPRENAAPDVPAPAERPAGSDFAAQMLEGYDKYRAMMRVRLGSDRLDWPQRDREL